LSSATRWSGFRRSNGLMLRPFLTALLGVALCLAGGTFDSASLYVPGVGLIVLAVGAFVWVRLAVRGATVERVPGPHTVVEEEPYPLRVEVRSGVLPPPGGELLEPLLGWPVPVGGRWSRRLRINVRFSRRGRRVLEPELLVIRDPLRLYSREIEGKGGEEVLVLPRVEPVTAPGSGGAGAGAQAGLGAHPGLSGRRLDASAAELEIDGLRAYREGAPASRIHWPSVARHGEMLERRLVAELDSAPLIVMDPSNPASEEALDKAVRAAASLCVWLARSDGCAVLLPGDRRPIDISHDLGAWPAVHARLALVDEGPAPAAGVLGPRGGAVIWVTGADLRSTPRVLERLPAGSRYVVTPGAMPGVRASFEVAGCTGCLMERARRATAGRSAGAAA
jgi:uncharacterized protein (DUF58 family)